MSQKTEFHNHIAGNFTTVPNRLVTDNSLSWKAKGVFLYLASKPSKWKFYMTDIESHATDGRESLQSGVAELEDKGYLLRERGKDENGKFTGWHWHLVMPDKRETRQTGNPPDGKTTGRETPLYSNTNNSNTDLSNTDNRKSTLDGIDFPKCAEYAPQAVKVAERLFVSILQWNPSHKYSMKSPAIDKWAIDIERGMRQYGYTIEALYALIEYIFTQNTEVADFWKPNIQSGAKLIEHYDRLVTQIKTEIKTKKKNGKIKPNREELKSKFARKS